MNLAELFAGRSLSSKQKTEKLASRLVKNPKEIASLIAYAKEAKDPVKASCLETIEFATKKDPAVSTPESFKFVTQCLIHKAPRIKRESARVIGNTAHLHTALLREAVKNLLVNSEHAGTVVRWGAAYALGEIVKLEIKHNENLIPAIKAICKREEKNSIKKIYIQALKSKNEHP